VCFSTVFLSALSLFLGGRLRIRQKQPTSCVTSPTSLITQIFYPVSWVPWHPLAYCSVIVPTCVFRLVRRMSGTWTWLRPHRSSSQYSRILRKTTRIFSYHGRTIYWLEFKLIFPVLPGCLKLVKFGLKTSKILRKTFCTFCYGYL
jgi:hypothetical protein